MKIIDLQHESLTLDEVIELARHDAVSIITRCGEEVYVAHLGLEAPTPSQIESKIPIEGALTQEEVEEAIEEELACFEASLLSNGK